MIEEFFVVKLCLEKSEKIFSEFLEEVMEKEWVIEEYKVKIILLMFENDYFKFEVKKKSEDLY